MRRLLLGIALLVALSRGGFAQATYDAFTIGECHGTGALCTAGNTTLTVPHATGSGSSRGMDVFVFTSCGSASTAPAISSVTYDTTQTLTSQVGPVSPAASRYGQLFALPAGTQPNSGTHNLVVVLASSLVTDCGGSSTLQAMVFTTSGVDQSTLYTSTGSNSGTGTSATITGLTSGANDLGVDAVCGGNGITSTTETSRGTQTDDTSNSCGTGGGATAAGGDTSWSWTIPSDSWIMVGAVRKAAGGAASTCKGRLALLGAGC